MSTKTKAYSYLRISTDQQRIGDGVRRQLEASKTYAEKHGYELVEEMQDIGISAFKGKNATVGALGAFIKALDDGKIPSGSVLLVENLDRLSRSTVLEAFAQFTNILNKGVGIVTLTDGQHYTAESVNQNVGQLFMSMGGMLRAHEESVVKSKRVGAAWKRKRETIGDKILTKNIPKWLNISDDGKSFVVDEQRAETVRTIFKLCIEGMGGYSIAVHLNENLEKYPTFTNKEKWEFGYINNILRSVSTYGAIQYRKTIDGKRVPTGDPVENYYPPVISKDTFNLAHSRIDKRKLGSSGGRKGEALSNIFGNLITCGKCGGKVNAMRRYGRNNKRYGYLRCLTSQYKLGCDCGGWLYDEFESSFIDFVREVDFNEVFASEDNSEQQRNLEGQKVTALNKIASLNTAMESLLRQFESNDLPDTLRNRLITRSQDIEAEIKETTQTVSDLDKKLAELSTNNMAKEKQEFLDQYDELRKTNDTGKLRVIRFSMSTMIKRYVDRMTIHNDFSIFPWEADDVISNKLRSELGETDLEEYFSKPTSQRKYVESERYYTVKFKSGAVRVIHPYENKTYMSVSERLAAMRKGG